MTNKPDHSDQRLVDFAAALAEIKDLADDPTDNRLDDQFQDSHGNPERESLSDIEKLELERVERALMFIQDAREGLHDDTSMDTPAIAGEVTPDGLEAAPIPPDDDEEIPQNVGRFQLQKLLGQGGFAKVWLAWDPILDRQVAIKLLRSSHFFSDEVKARFGREARAAAILSHPNIVPVFESGTIDNERFLVAGYCRGTTLEQWLRDRESPIDQADAAKVVARLAEAVEHAHQRGVIHRDLKPANILVEDQDRDVEVPVAERLRITDFGLAKQIEAANQVQTAEGAIVGTPAYMSPEQAGGSSEVDHASDIYSLGVILYELITGQVPHRCDCHIDTLLAIRERDAKPPRQINTAIDRDLEAICLRCLQRKPERRYQSAHEISADLNRWLAGEIVAARRVTRVERVRKWCQRNPLVTTLLLAVVCALAVAVWQWIESGSNFRQAVEQTNIARKETSRAENYLDNMTNIVDGFLDEMASIGEPNLVSKTQRDRLNQILELQKSLVAEQTQDRQIRSNTLRAYRRIAKIHSVLGNRQAAYDALQAARSQFLVPVGVDASDDAEYLKVVLSVQIQLVNALAAQRLMDEAKHEVEWMGDLLETSGSVLPDQDRLYYLCVHANYEGLMNRSSQATLPQAIEFHKEAETYGNELLDNFEPDVDRAEAVAQNLINLANIQSSLGKSTEASLNFGKGVDIILPVLLEHPQSCSLRRTLALTQLNWCTTLLRLQEFEQAEVQGRQAVEGFRQLIDEIPDNGKDVLPLAASLSNHSDALQKLGRIDEALEANQQAIDLKDKGLSANFTGKRVIVSIMLSRSRTQSAAEDPDAAWAAARDAIEAWEEYFGDVEQSFRTEQLKFDVWKRYVESAGDLNSSETRLVVAKEFYNAWGTYEVAKADESSTVPVAFYAELKADEAAALSDLGQFDEAIATAAEIAGFEVTVNEVSRKLYLEAAAAIAFILNGIETTDGEADTSVLTAQHLAIDLLQNAIDENGFDDADALESAPEWAGLRKLERFRELVNSISQSVSSKY